MNHLRILRTSHYASFKMAKNMSPFVEDGGDELFMGYGAYVWAKRIKIVF